MIRKITKYIITIAIFLGIVFPLSAQQGAFHKAMKQGKRANGYYHIDFTHTQFSKRQLAKFIGKKGYYVTNVNAKKVLQYGDCFEAVTSLDFLTLDETMEKYKNAIDAELERTGDKNIDENTQILVRQILAATVNTENDIVPVELSSFNESSKEEMEKEWDNYVRAGLSCGFYCFDATEKTWSHKNKSNQTVHYAYKFISFEAVNELLAKKFSFDNVSSSIGSGYVYKSGSDFNRTNNFIWLGDCVNGEIDGLGIGYTTDKSIINVTSVFKLPNPDIIYSVDGMKINCFVGEYKNGSPTGECKHYSFYIRELIDDKPIDSYVTTTIYPFSDGLARYVEAFVGRSNTSYVDSNYVVKLRNVDQIQYLKCSPLNSVVKDFENGLLTLNSNIYDHLKIEFFVDKNGDFVSLTKKGQALVDSIIDETVSQYNKYISKVFNPNDILQPTGTLKKRFNYDLKSFPATAYNNIRTESICEQAVENYKKRKTKDFDKSDYAAKVAKLLTNMTYYLENVDKAQLEADITRDAHIRLNVNNWSSFFTYRKDRITDELKEIGKEKLRPGNFPQIVSVVSKTFDEYIEWWAPIYQRMVQTVNELIEEKNRRIKQYMDNKCSKCKIDGSQTTYPKGYYEGYESWFSIRPAESEEEGEIVFANGDKCKWKYVFKGANSTELDYIDVNGHNYYGKYDSINEMVIELKRKCESYWCR